MKFLPFLLCALIVLPFVTAIGISPPTGKLNFEPGASGEFDVLLHNSRDRDIATSVEIKGDLAEYIKATNPGISARGSATATITYALPDDIPPGRHVQSILIYEEFFDPDEGGIAARTAVGFRFIIWKPYPGRYAELHMRPYPVPAGQNTQLEVTIKSRGDQPITGDIDVRVLDPQGNLQDRLLDPDIDVGANTDRTRFLQVDSASWEPGKYRVEGRYDFAAGVAETETSLILGSKTLLLLNVSDTYYKDQPINRFDVLVESMWNEPLAGVSASFALGRSEGITPAITLASFAQKELHGYWETDTAIPEGEHTVVVTGMLDGGEPVQESFVVHVYNETPQPELNAPEPFIELGTVDILFIVILLILIIYFIYDHSKRRRV